MSLPEHLSTDQGTNAKNAGSPSSRVSAALRVSLVKPGLRVSELARGGWELKIWREKRMFSICCRVNSTRQYPVLNLRC
jgi:hypothetical protein